MFKRCYVPSTNGFKSYGGKGISVCSEWRSFAAFLADMGPKPTPGHTLERRSTRGNYEPGNCHWATWKEQAANRSSHGATPCQKKFIDGTEPACPAGDFTERPSVTGEPQAS